MTEGLRAAVFNLDSSAQFAALVEGVDVNSALFNIESLELGRHDDSLEIVDLVNETTSLKVVYGGGNGALGDKIDLSYITTAGATVDLENGTVRLTGSQDVLSVHDFENIVGTAQNDILTGDDNANGINGHLGADELFGGGADDFIFFDADDTEVYGGAGRDVAVALGTDGVTVNMAAQGLECVIGGDGADVITVGGQGNVMVAGGGGADSIIVTYGNGQDTRILWGSDDSAADEFLFVNSGEAGAQLGLLVVTVAGLTSRNFADFDLSKLNLPASFNWGAIDAVIINPDSNDQYYTGFDTAPIFTEYFGLQAIDETLSASAWDGEWLGSVKQAVEGTSPYLGASLHMQVAETGVFAELWYRNKGDTATAWLNGVESYDQGIEDMIAELTDEFGQSDATWSVDMSALDDNGEGTAMMWFRDAEWTGGPDEYDMWFVAGGAMQGTQFVANGAPHAVMPEITDPSPFDWLLAA